MALMSIPRDQAGPRKPLPRVQHPDELQLVRQTFRDLEIFESEDNAASIFDLFNFTRTAGGERTLRARWRKPWSNAQHIREVQEALRFVLDHRAAFDLLPSDAALGSVDDYVHSGLTLLDTASAFEFVVGAVEIRFGDFKEYWKIAKGLRRTATFIAAYRQFAFNEVLAGAPGQLGAWLQEMRDLLNRPAFGKLPRDGTKQQSFFRTLALDRLLRWTERESIERLMRLLFEIDALVSMAEAIRRHDLALPEVHEGPLEIIAEGIYHPFLSEPVPNGLAVDQQRRLLFLTGPNMAGKTTYLRACGIALYLAHLGMGVPARSFRFSPCDTVLSAISLSDNVRKGISFFRAEALRIKAIASAIAEGKRVVALLDEPFMGTNVKDALDASRSVLTRLAEKQGSVFLVSSHLIELADGLVAGQRVECFHFEASEAEGRLQFDYLLRPGISSQRLGMRVLKEEGVFDLLDAAETPVQN